ncbi:MAG: ribosome biogenesis GTPase Der [Bdellovibrionales bacterium]|nr:ribosome biogenesis GTPase Der [Bdellovibrionales bacterium]
MSYQKLKRVALVGRPNVGKSTLFNRLTRSRKAVVKDEPGVTRDIQIEPTEWWGKSFEVVDTGGISEGKDGFTPLIRETVVDFLNSVDLVIFVVDGRAGIVPEDRVAYRTIKATGLPFVTVVNKCDRTLEPDEYLADFYEFGEDLIPAAFERDYNVDVVVEWLLAHLGDKEHTVRDGFRLAIVGKPNAGKSSLANRLLGEKRMLVSELAGTTVDAVEAEFEFNGKEYILADTAGLRRAGKQKDGVEVLSGFKTRDAVHKSDLILLVIDGTQGPSHQDSRIIEMCLEEHKAIIVVANKTDLGREQHENFRDWFRERVEREFHYFSDIPLAFVSAKNGTGLEELFRKIEDLREKLAIRISTSKLNKFFTEVIKQAPSPVYRTENVKFYYLTQTNQSPPSFIAFANHPDGVTPAYRRFLIRKIQEQWDLKGVPMRIFVMKKGGE